MSIVDVLAFGAHPDDAEIGCGGTLLKLKESGRQTGIVDLVRGEMGTRGDAETRATEAERSSQILGLAARENLALEDGHIRMTEEGKRRVVMVTRRLRPRAVFLPYGEDRHPDHYNASHLIYEGLFLAGLARYDTGQPPHRPEQVFYYMGWYEFEPTFIVDITDQAERKLEAIYAYSTQFDPNATRDSQTRLTSPTTDWMLRSRMAYYGSKIRRRFGEGFLIRGRLEVEDPLDLRFQTF